MIQLQKKETPDDIAKINTAQNNAKEVVSRMKDTLEAKGSKMIGTVFAVEVDRKSSEMEIVLVQWRAKIQQGGSY